MKELALMAVILTGCAAQQGPAQVETLPPMMGTRPAGPAGAPQIDSCGLGSIGDLVGKAVTETMADDARKRSGARAARVIRPGTMVTMDFRPDRLNIDVDDKGIVTNLRCG